MLAAGVTVDDLQSGHRYNAACAAALTAAGQGKDPTKPSEQECTRWRQQALDWLRADLVLWAKALDSEMGVSAVSLTSQAAPTIVILAPTGNRAQTPSPASTATATS